MPDIVIHPLVEGLAGHTASDWVDVETETGPTHRFPVYQMADERYISCGAVVYHKQTGKTPGYYCHDYTAPPAECSLAGRGVPCAFCDPSFDWSRISDKRTIWPAWSHESLENELWFRAGHTEPPPGGNDGTSS